MAWFPDSNWLKALEIKGSTAAAVAVACIMILVMAFAGWFFLDTLPAWVKAVVAAVAFLAIALTGGNVLQWFIDESSKKRERRRQEEEQRAEERKREDTQERHRQKVLGYLDTLSDREYEILSYLVQKNQQSFTAEMGGTRIATLQQKGLIEMATGIYSSIDWPYTIPNFVWEELQRCKDAFTEAGLSGTPPWRDPEW
jgi:hypothetical protein